MIELLTNHTTLTYGAKGFMIGGLEQNSERGAYESLDCR